MDRTILYYLQQDGRRAITDIADALDVSDNTVRNRLEAMEEAGGISGYTVDVDYDQLDVPLYYVFICSVRVSERDQLVEEARDLPGIIEVLTLMTGTNNVILFGAGARKDDITELANNLDDLGLTIEQEHLVRDHIRQPYSGFQPPGYMEQR